MFCCERGTLARRSDGAAGGVFLEKLMCAQMELARFGKQEADADDVLWNERTAAISAVAVQATTAPLRRRRSAGGLHSLSPPTTGCAPTLSRVVAVEPHLHRTGSATMKLR
ncbi:hypothetical protein NL676_018913 [Syzygium grande]|nr:hypothetical protein NL676_018913 [Syzygium grande]